MVKKIIFVSLVIIAGFLTALYFIDDRVIMEVKNTASHLKHELKYKVEKTKWKGERLARDLSAKAQRKGEELRYHLDKQKGIQEVKLPDSSVIQKMTKEIEGILNRIQNNALNIYDKFKNS